MSWWCGEEFVAVPCSWEAIIERTKVDPRGIVTWAMLMKNTDVVHQSDDMFEHIAKLSYGSQRTSTNRCCIHKIYDIVWTGEPSCKETKCGLQVCT